MTPAEQRLIDVALLMAQELQEFVDDAVSCSGGNDSLPATQELLKDWEEAYKACELTEEDHFQEARAAADRINPWHYPPEIPINGQRILMVYRCEDWSESCEVVHTWRGQMGIRPLVRWMAIPEV